MTVFRSNRHCETSEIG